MLFKQFIVFRLVLSRNPRYMTVLDMGNKVLLIEPVKLSESGTGWT